jgi:DNA-binding phage protein
MVDMTAPARPFRQTRNAILRDPDAAALYLEETLAAGDTDAFKLALRNVVEARATWPRSPGRRR